MIWVSFSTRRQKAGGQDWIFFVSPPGSDTLQAPSSGAQRGRQTRPAPQKPEPTTHSILTASQILLLILGRGEAGTRGRGGRGNQKGPGEGRGGPALQIVPRARQPPPGWASPGQKPSALKGETVPDSLPATPKSPPTRRVPPRGTPRVPPAGSTHSSTRGLRPPEQLERPAAEGLLFLHGLENSMDRGAWLAKVHGVTKSRT